MRSFNIGIIGAGLIGRKRAVALQHFGDCSLQTVADLRLDAERALTQEFGGEPFSNWKQVVDRDDIDIVVVSTINSCLAEISAAAARSGKHVLCEKPLGRNSREAQIILDAAKSGNAVVKTGFNHRYHPGIWRAKALLDEGRIGNVMFLRCRYGHGGRPGYEKEWRASKEHCGGGEMLDQGVHVVDLFRWFAGDFSQAFGFTPTCFWPMQVEDNAFALFKNDQGVVASMHTSWTQWKNLFSFEVFGSDGYLIVEGLGGSYGTETLRIGKRRPEGGAPDEETLVFDGLDMSWRDEWKEFLEAIHDRREPIGGGDDGYQANRMIEAVYESVRTSGMVAI